MESPLQNAKTVVVVAAAVDDRSGNAAVAVEKSIGCCCRLHLVLGGVPLLQSTGPSTS